jgi:hypothetical protein
MMLVRCFVEWHHCPYLLQRNKPTLWPNVGHDQALLFPSSDLLGMVSFEPYDAILPYDGRPRAESCAMFTSFQEMARELLCVRHAARAVGVGKQCDPRRTELVLQACGARDLVLEFSKLLIRLSLM